MRILRGSGSGFLVAPVGFVVQGARGAGVKVRRGAEHLGGWVSWGSGSVGVAEPATYVGAGLQTTEIAKPISVARVKAILVPPAKT